MLPNRVIFGGCFSCLSVTVSCSVCFRIEKYSAGIFFDDWLLAKALGIDTGLRQSQKLVKNLVGQELGRRKMKQGTLVCISVVMFLCLSSLVFADVTNEEVEKEKSYERNVSVSYKYLQ